MFSKWLSRSISRKQALKTDKVKNTGFTCRFSSGLCLTKVKWSRPAIQVLTFQFAMVSCSADKWWNLHLDREGGNLGWRFQYQTSSGTQSADVDLKLCGCRISERLICLDVLENIIFSELKKEKKEKEVKHVRLRGQQLVHIKTSCVFVFYSAFLFLLNKRTR